GGGKCGCSTAGDCAAQNACDATGLCTTTCSSTQACNGGCCNGTTCAVGTLPGACGSTGGMCNDCSVSTNGHACISPGSSQICGCSSASDCPNLQACTAGVCGTTCTSGQLCNGG